jgi:uncharacterized protein YecE (DUF72 family)
VTVFIGPAGWSYADWSGIVYPKPRPRGFSELGFLARYFSAIEINTTFYRPVEPSMARTWARRVSGLREFAFTAKLWQKFTHEAGAFDAGDVRTYLASIEPLRQAGLLGAVLAQFPWSFSDSEESRGRVRKIREAFPDLPMVVEVRHASWGAAPEFLSEEGLGFCNIDQPSRGLSETAHVTSKVAYVRLHGRNREAWFNPRSSVAEKYDYLYSPEELEPWAKRIRKMAEKAERIFVIANNHYQGKAVANALQVKSMLSGGAVEAPAGLEKRYPALERFVSKRVGQAELF